MVGKTEGAKTRVSRKETVEKTTTRTYRKSPSRLLSEKSLSRGYKSKSPVRKSPTRVARSPKRATKSPTRVTKSPTRVTKSPTRATKSPTRATKSPTRVTKSPTRVTKSPTRAVKSKETKKPQRALSTRTRSPSRAAIAAAESVIPVPKVRQSVGRKSITRRSPIRVESERVTKKVDTVELDTESDSESESSKKSSFISKLRKSLSREPSESVDGGTRRSPRSGEFDRVVHLKNHYEPVAKLTEFSDEDELICDAEEKKKPKLQSKIRHVNLVMTILDLALSLGFIVALLAVCTEVRCTYSVPKVDSFKLILTYFDNTALLYTAVFYAFIFALSALPFGGRKVHGPLTKSGKFTYNMNGLFCAFATFVVLGALEYYTENVFDYVFENVRKILVSSFMLAVVFGVAVYARSMRVPLTNLNGSALENSFLFNFIYGSEVNPRFGSIDIKTVLFRANYILALVVWGAGLYNSVQWTTKGPFEFATALEYIQINRVNYTALALSVMTVFFLLDALVFEHTWTSTAELQYETFGFMKCIEYCVFFNYFGLMPKHILDNNVNLETWKVALALVVFFIGFFIYRASILQKHAFRENPYSPRVAHLESIPSGGKKIICSSYWGFVRHPNYLGDIIMNVAFLILIYNNPLSILNFVGILRMFQRAHGDNVRCGKRYGPAWERYSQRVRYMLVPKVY